jgi:hypothetical protein
MMLARALRLILVVTVAVLVANRATVAGEEGQATTGMDRATFLPLYQAATAVAAATEDSEMTRTRIATLVPTLGKEVSIAKPLAKTPVEVQMVAFYSEALEAYRDGLQFWELRRFANRRGRSAPLDALAEKYGIQPVTTNSYLSTWQRYPNAVSKIWAVGNAATTKANVLYSK